MTIQIQTAKRLARKYANAEPDKVVACKYVNDNKPECIVGNILINDLGVPISLFTANNDFNNGVAINSFGDGVAELPKFSKRALRYLTELQAKQDLPTKTWGEALEHAEKIDADPPKNPLGYLRWNPNSPMASKA